MYSAYNEGTSVVTERFTRTLGKIIVDKYNNTYHRSFGKKPILANYSVLTEQIETNYKVPKFKVGDRVRIN